MKANRRKAVRRCLFRMVGAVATWTAGAFSAQAGNNQTDAISPIIIGGDLPYKVSVSLAAGPNGGGTYPSLHSFALGVYNEKWVIVGGRTNGLHSLAGGINSFPPASQNKEIWVIDPVARTVQHRSFANANDPNVGLTQLQIDALSSTNAEAAQIGDRLYVAGGYFFDSGTMTYTTYDTLTALDLAGVVDWVNGSGKLSLHIRQCTANDSNNLPIFKVTGGALHVTTDGTGNHALMIFGQDYEGVYNGQNGIYTLRVRAFDIKDNGTTLSVDNILSHAQDASYRRRDLNVVPILTNGVGGSLAENFVALSGFFTLNNGAWTVPVDVHAPSGISIMANPSDPDTFKQGMNNYECAAAGLYSESRQETHTILFGGISYGYFDTSAGSIAFDDQFPFINSISSIVRTGGLLDGAYTQYYLGEFPTLTFGGGSPLLFGTNAKFIPAPGVATYPNGLLKMDALTKPTMIGYIFGGIISNQPNGGATIASSLIFEVNYLPPIAQPVIRVTGKSRQETQASSHVIKGRASSSASFVEWQLNKRKLREDEVKANGRWKIRVRGLSVGKNLVRIRGVSVDGQHSKKRVVKIFRLARQS